jgi:hypothetical protein
VGALASVNGLAEEVSSWSGKLQRGPGMAHVRSNGSVQARHEELHGRAPMADRGSVRMRLELQPLVARLFLASKGAWRRGFTSKAWSAC